MNDLIIKPKSVRLNKYLAWAGLGSRRGVEHLILSGQVIVNGNCIRNPAYRVNPEKDEVIVQGNPISTTFVPTYIMLNKPQGYITTAKDEKGRETVYKLVHPPVRVFPVGRLDRDSEGLLLMTNDGELAYRLTHPRYQIKKKYLVYLNHSVLPEQVRAFSTGIRLGRGPVVKGEIRFPHPGDRKTCLVTITEGKYRQIRRMFAALGLRVKYLQRIAIGPIELKDLPVGSWRYLTEKEITMLRQLVGLTNGNQ